MKFLPRALTTRLVLTAVTLVAVVGVLVAVSATLAMRSYLYDQKDGEVRDVLDRATLGGLMPQMPGVPGGHQNPVPNAGPNSVSVFSPTADGDPVGIIPRRQVRRGASTFATLPEATTARLLAVPQDREAHDLEIGDTSYRVMAAEDQNGNPVVIGLSSEDVDDTLSNMSTWFALLTICGVGLAGVGGTLLVRRQLRPLREVVDAAHHVTAQDLSSGRATIATRVAPELTDEATEVGQVGSALNTLLDHVDAALESRHRSEQQVRQFVADASHELRTPLSTIHGYAELARRTPDEAAALSTALDKVETEAGRMSALVEDLLLLARLDSGRPLAPDEVDLTRLLLEAVADARVLAPEHRWQLDLPDEPVTVTGDADRLHQVVTNLLGNARHHTPAGTTVTVGVRTTGDGTRISVHDDGPGLPADIVDHAFERFTRGDSSRTRASGGAGLGLSLVRAITEAHGGSAAVTSTPGSTTFTVTLPGPAT